MDPITKILEACLRLVTIILGLGYHIRDGLNIYTNRVSVLENVMLQYKDHEVFLNRLIQALKENPTRHDQLHSDVISNYLKSVKISLEKAETVMRHMERMYTSETASSTCHPTENSMTSSFRRFKKRLWTKNKVIVSEMFNIESFSQTLESLNEIHKDVADRLFHVSSYLDIPSPNTKDTECDIYEPFYAAPLHQSRSNMVLDFNVNCDGDVETPEGRIKQQLLKRSNDGTFCVIGDGAKIGGAHGMGGVGKTITLQALCEEEDVRAAFKDGVYFLVFGMDVTDKLVQEKLANCVCDFGGKEESKEIRSLRELDGAVEKGAKWFAGRSVLFVCDDMWPSDKSNIGYIHHMRRLMKETVKSSMLFSTRSMTIANEADDCVKFGCVSPQSSIAREILFSWAFGEKDSKSSLGTESEDAVTYVLGKCAGLHLTLSIAGSAVKKNMLRFSGDRRLALQQYVRSLKNEEVFIIDGTLKDYGGLVQLIRSSLSRCIQWGNSGDVESVYGRTFNMNEIFQALCVFAKQMVMPVSALRLLWGLSNDNHTIAVMKQLEEYQLANRCIYMNASSEEEYGLSLHDLVLETCQVVTGGKKVEMWHAQILNAYCNVPSTMDNGNRWNEESRPWWDIKDDGYLHNNISRHLTRAGLREELELLVCDVRWVQKCAEGKGWIGFGNDIDELQNSDQISERSGLSVLRRVLKCNWDYVLAHPKWFGFQIFGGLGLEERRLRLVARLLLTIEQYLTRPWAKPAKKCLYAIDEREVECYSLQNLVHDLVVDWGRRIMYVASGSDILVKDMAKRKLLRNLKGHTDYVTCLAITGDGTRLVSGSKDRTICRWKIGNEESIGEALQGHTDGVSCLAITDNERHVISGSYDCTIRRWDMESGESIGGALIGHTDRVTSLAITGNGTQLLSGSYDCTIRQWDLAKGNSVGEPLRGRTGVVTCITVTSDGTLLVSGSEDGTISLWNLKAGKVIWKTTKGHTYRVASLAITGNEKTIVSGAYDNTICQWDVKTGKRVGEALTGHTNGVTCLAITGNPTLIISGSRDHTIREWDMKATKSVGEAAKEGTDVVTCITITDDGALMVSGSGDGTIRRWNMKTGEVIGKALEGHAEKVTCLAILCNGRQIVSGSDDNTVCRWDFETGEKVGEAFKGHTQGVTCLALTGDERQVLSWSSDKTIRRWDMATGESAVVALKVQMEWVTSLAITSDGRQMVAGSGHGNIRRWNMKNGEIIGEALKEHTDKVTCLALTNDDKEFVSGSLSGTILRWDMKTGNVIGRATTDQVHWIDDFRTPGSQEWKVPVSFNLTGWVKAMVPGHVEAVYMGSNKFAARLGNGQVIVACIML